MNQNTDPIYSFFTTKINQAENEIRTNAIALSALSKKQTELKRGKTYLVKLRREYLDKSDIKPEHADLFVKQKEEDVTAHICICKTCGVEFCVMDLDRDISCCPYCGLKAKGTHEKEKT